MSPKKSLTIEFIKQVAEALGDLNEKAVFVGGATVPFYLTDVMSPDEKAMGFSNKWYPDGVKHSQVVKANGVEVRILTLPYFLATKIEAFKDRGNDDFIASPDMEDIITVFDGAPKEQLEDEYENAESNLKKYLKKELTALADDLDFQAAVPGSVFDRGNARERAKIILKRIHDLIQK